MSQTLVYPSLLKVGGPQMVHTWIPGNQAGAAFPLEGPAQVFLIRVRACWGVGSFSQSMGQS